MLILSTNKSSRHRGLKLLGPLDLAVKYIAVWFAISDTYLNYIYQHNLAWFDFGGGLEPWRRGVDHGIVLWPLSISYIAQQFHQK